MGLPVVRREQRFDSLGLKLNLALLMLFIVIGGATAAFVFFGFDRTRDNATGRSQEALEQLGSQLLRNTADTSSQIGAVQLEWAAEIGHRAARYMEQFKLSGATPAFDTSRFVQTPQGLWYDPDPNRISDVVIPNNLPLEGPVLDDLAYSAALDSIFPALIEGFPGEIAADAYHPIAITFVGVNGVGRYYPPIGVHQTTPAQIDLPTLFDEVNPQENPERKTVWSTPYQDPVGRGLVITAQTPVYDGDVFRGLLEVDLSISELVQVVDGVRPTQNGFAFYVDKEGQLLRTGAYDLLVNELNSQDNDVLARVIERMQRGEPGVDRLMIGGKEFFLASAPVQEVGGGFAVVAPVDELTAEAAAITDEIDEQADQTMLYVLVSMTALFAVALVLATYFNRRVLVRPIEALAEGTRAVAQGDFGAQIEVRGNDELAALGRSFNQMTADIQRAAQERQAAEEELRALFAAMTDWVIVLDKEGRYVRIPETSAPTLDLQPMEMPGKSLGEVVPPELAESMTVSIQQALREHTTVTEEIPYQVDGHTHWFSCAFSPISEDQVVMVARDVTERINARQELEHLVEERTRELQSLLTVSRNIGSNLTLQPLLQTIIEQLKSIADYSRCSIFVRDGDSLVMLDSRTSDSLPSPLMRVPLASIQGMWDLVGAGKVAIEGDVRNSGSAIAMAYQEGSGELFDTVYKDIHSWMGVPLEANERIIGMLTVSHNQPNFYTEHHAGLVTAVAAQVAVAIENARLYEQVKERTQELSSLLLVSRNVASNLALEPLIETILGQVREIADYSRCSIFLHEGDSLVLLDSRAPTGGGQSIAGWERTGQRLRLAEIEGLWQQITAGQVAIEGDVRTSGSPIAEAYRRGSGRLYDTDFKDIHSWMCVPLESKDRLIGMLTLSHVQPNFYTEHHAGLVSAVATQVAVAIENARLYEQVQERTQELAGLLTVSRNVTSTLELQPLLALIVEQLKSIVDFDRCSIFELEGDTMVILDSRATSVEPAPPRIRVPTGVLGPIWPLMSQGHAVIIDDVHDQTSDFAAGYRAAAGDLWNTPPFQAIHACIGVPLKSKDQIIGMVVLTHLEPAFYTDRHAELVSAVATQIAVAIENARLYEQAQQLAAVEERQRLARELHDSVSQALYGIALGARTARTLLDREPDKASEPVDYVLSLAEAGLAEMRALIFELRPESLEIEGLMAALEKNAAATAARYNIKVKTELSEEPDMDLAKKEIFYRIGQEALHNVVKHAHATEAVVRFGGEDGSYTLEIGDNGVGFDPSRSFPGHMGLVSMSERASSIGAELEVDSRPGRGTVVRLRSRARALSESG